jgi:hypothetical protein
MSFQNIHKGIAKKDHEMKIRKQSKAREDASFRNAETKESRRVAAKVSRRICALHEGDRKPFGLINRSHVDECSILPSSSVGESPE